MFFNTNILKSVESSLEVFKIGNKHTKKRAAKSCPNPRIYENY
jgi:hypothetical protein